MQLYPRKILLLLKKEIKSRTVVVLTGMRRTGKTTVCRMIFDEIPSANKAFFDLENPLEQRIFEETDYNNIWSNLKEFGINNKQRSFIFLDEIQAYPEIVKIVKYLYDHYDVKFFLTGSSSFYLKNLFPESLAGRKIVFELYPLDFEEFLVFKQRSKIFYYNFADKAKNKNFIAFEKTKKLYDEYLEFGGFPEAVLTESNQRKKQQLADILKSYFEKDVRSLADFKDINVFRNLLLLLMQRVGFKLEISKLASEVGVSRDTVYSYISFLQQTYFIDLISPFTKNVDREVSGAKKVYLCDNGMVSQFAKVSDGVLLENAVFRNLKKYGRLMYYQKRSGGEIDFIIPQANVALEVKQTGTAQEYKNLQKLAKSLKVRSCYIATKNFNEQKGFIPALEV